MKAVKITKNGGPEVLELKDIKLGDPKTGEVLIKNKAIGLNYIDTYHRSGLYPLPLPSGIGLEASGKVDEVGSNIKDFNKGDNVAYASMPIGAYSQQRIIPAKIAVKIPEWISHKLAATLMTKGLTTNYLLTKTYKLTPNETILFHAAAGGVGQILCQWANAIGCTVIGTVGSKEKEAIAKKNGCHHVINYTDNNFVEEVEKIVGKNGIDVVYDGVGAKTFEGSIECLKVRGMMVAFGNASGYVHTLDIKKHINAKGLFFTRPSIAHYTVTRKELEDSAAKVFDAILSGKIKVEVFKKYSLSEVKKAHEDLEARLLTGPVVILP